MILSALWTVMTRSLIRSAIGLALTSAILTVFMFRLDSPLAAVFELSVCSGLISVLFLSTISLTHPMTKEELNEFARERLSRFRFLPYLVLVVGIMLGFMRMNPQVNMFASAGQADARSVLWNLRQVDLIGQVIILLTGVFGVVLLLKEARKK